MATGEEASSDESGGSESSESEEDSVHDPEIAAWAA